MSEVAPGEVGHHVLLGGVEGGQDSVRLQGDLVTVEVPGGRCQGSGVDTQVSGARYRYCLDFQVQVPDKSLLPRSRLEYEEEVSGKVPSQPT